MPAVLGLQPAVASRTAFDDLPAVAATDGSACPDKQPLAASGTGGLSVVAIGPIRAAIEIASVPGVFALLQAPLDTLWTGHVVFRQSSEDSDVVPVVDQFQHEGRGRIAIRKKEDAVLGARDGDVEQASLLGIRVRLGRRENQIEERVVGDLRGKSVSSDAEPEHDDVIGFKPFRAVHGHIGDAEAGVLFH